MAMLICVRHWLLICQEKAMITFLRAPHLIRISAVGTLLTLLIWNICLEMQPYSIRISVDGMYQMLKVFLELLHILPHLTSP